MMKRVLISTLLLMILSVGTASANTIASSTMYFQGQLTIEASGAYTGTIGAIADFDVYAKVGSIVDSPDSSIDGSAVGADHDAYPLWTPDVPDAYDESGGHWDYYALNLDGSTNTWELWYVNPRHSLTQGFYNDGTTTYDYEPLGGTVDWSTGLATETGQNWEQQWSSKYENIQLEYPYFAVSVTPVAGAADTYLVSLTPVPVPGAVLLGLLGLSAAGIKLRKYA